MSKTTAAAPTTTTRTPVATTTPASGDKTLLKGCALTNCCQKTDCTNADKISLRAYQMWEEAKLAAERGERAWPNPDGNEFWFAAERELTAAKVTIEQVEG